jgi:hypothetical protein
MDPEELGHGAHYTCPNCHDARKPSFESPANNTRLQKHLGIRSETSNEEERSVDGMQKEAFNDSVDSSAKSSEDNAPSTSHNAIVHCIARNRLPRGNVPFEN